jgi:anti-sigma B factor antagonist
MGMTVSETDLGMTVHSMESPSRTLQPETGEVRFKVTGSLDRRSACRFVESLKSVEASGPSRLTIDLQRCSFLDVVGACVLLDAARRARVGRREIALAAPPPVVRRMLELTAVDRVLEIEPPSSTESCHPGHPTSNGGSHAGSGALAT